VRCLGWIIFSAGQTTPSLHIRKDVTQNFQVEHGSGSTSNDGSGLLDLPEAELLATLCQKGKLYEVEKWIHAGKSLRVPRKCKTTPLRIALERGFHSLVELLAGNDVGQEAKNQALLDAVTHRNFEFVELLLKLGADISSVPFSDVLLSWDPKLIRFFLSRGADFITGAPFAEAFREKVRTALGPFMECKRSHPEFVRELQAQADSALRYFCQSGSEKWVSLMVWAGANPRTPGPMPGEPDDSDNYTTALEQASHNGKLTILKMLRPDPDRDNISELVHNSAMFGYTEAVTFLLELNPNLNDKPNGGSSALDGSLWHLGLDHVAPFFRKSRRALYEVRSSLNLIQTLVQHGAVWRPNGAYAVNSLRRTLFECDPAVTTELLKIFTAHEACSEETSAKLLRTPRMKLHLAPIESRLPRRPAKKTQNRGESERLDDTEARKRKALEPSAPSYALLRKYNRDVLYGEVWAEPIQKLAAKYGISDVGLAKVCRKLRVPVPGRGYWAKKTAGKKVRKRPAPPSSR
jgi:hypothetical protein